MTVLALFFFMYDGNVNGVVTTVCASVLCKSRITIYLVFIKYGVNVTPVLSVPPMCLTFPCCRYFHYGSVRIYVVGTKLLPFTYIELRRHMIILSDIF